MKKIIILVLITILSTYPASAVTIGTDSDSILATYFNLTSGVSVGTALASLQNNDSGTINVANYATLQDAINATNPNGTVFFNGTQDISSTITVSKGITIQCSPQSKINLTSGITGVTITASWVTINDCYIEGNNIVGTGGIFSNTVDTTLYRNNIRNTKSYGIRTSDLRSTIERNTIEVGSGADGIQLGSDDSYIVNNLIGSGATAGGTEAGIRLDDTLGNYAGINLISGNQIHDMGIGIDGYNMQSGNKIVINTIDTMQHHGIRLRFNTSTDAYSPVSLNILKDLGQAGSGVAVGIYLENITNNSILGNSFYGNLQEYDIKETLQSNKNSIIGNVLTKSILRSGNQTQIPVKDYGVLSDAPGGAIFGDSYSNSTSGELFCKYGTQWQNATGNTTVC